MRRLSSTDLLPLFVADVYECAGALRHVGDVIASEAGQTQARWQVLSVLSDGEWTAATAARRLGISRQAVQRIADLLIDEGLVAPRPNPANRRSPLLTLTRSGRSALTSIAPVAARWHRKAARSLDESELQQARILLQTITQRCYDALAD